MFWLYAIVPTKTANWWSLTLTDRPVELFNQVKIISARGFMDDSMSFFGRTVSCLFSTCEIAGKARSSMRTQVGGQVRPEIWPFWKAHIVYHFLADIGNRFDIFKVVNFWDQVENVIPWPKLVWFHIKTNAIWSMSNSSIGRCSRHQNPQNPYLGHLGRRPLNIPRNLSGFLAVTPDNHGVGTAGWLRFSCSAAAFSPSIHVWYRQHRHKTFNAPVSKPTGKSSPSWLFWSQWVRQLFRDYERQMKGFKEGAEVGFSLVEVCIFLTSKVVRFPQKKLTVLLSSFSKWMGLPGDSLLFKVLQDNNGKVGQLLAPSDRTKLLKKHEPFPSIAILLKTMFFLTCPGSTADDETLEVWGLRARFTESQNRICLGTAE